jgi:hypothetical protein
MYKLNIHRGQSSSSHPLDRSTAFCQHTHFLALEASSILGLKVVWAFAFTSLSVSGFVRFQPNKPTAAPAQMAEPKAVDLHNICVSDAFYEKLDD